MRTAVIIVLCAVLFTIGAIPNAEALNLWSFDFSGHIQQVSYMGDFPSAPPDPFASGDRFSGTFTYDLDVVDLWVQLGGKEQYPQSAYYPMGISDPYHGMQLQIGQYDFKTNPANVVQVWDNEVLNLGGADRLDFIYSMVRNPDFWGVTPYFPFGMQEGTISWTLQDQSMTAIHNQSLPTAIRLNDWLINEFNIRGAYYDFSVSDDRLYAMELAGTVDWIEAVSQGPAPVPEPATLLLLGAGLLSMTRLIRKKRGLSRKDDELVKNVFRMTPKNLRSPAEDSAGIAPLGAGAGAVIGRFFGS